MSGHRSDLRMGIDAIVDGPTARVSTDATVDEVARRTIDQSRCARAVAVEEDGTLAGIVTDRDLIATLLTAESEYNLLTPDRTAADVTAEDVMTPDPLTVPMDAAVPRVLRMMNEAGARYVPVVEDDAVVGVITLDDLIRHVAGESAHVSAQIDNLTGIIRAETRSD